MASSWSTHDAGVFRVEVPPEWMVEEPTSGTVVLREARSGRGEVSVTLRAVSRGPGVGVAKPSALDAQTELQKWLYSEKHVEVRQAPRFLNGTIYPTATTEALQPLPLEPAVLPWYKRLFSRRPMTLWRYWAVLNPHLLVLASCGGRPAAVEKLRPMIDRMIYSLHLPEGDILVGRNFTETVVSLARTWYPQTSVAIVDDGHLQFGSQSVSLVNLHRRYLASPQDLPRQVRAFFAAVRGDMPASALADTWNHARERVLPAFLTTRAINNARGRVLHEEWVNGLSIGYVMEDATPSPLMDAADADRAITRDDITRWNVAIEDLHTQALANLVMQSHEQTMHGQKGEGITMLCLGGNPAEVGGAATSGGGGPGGAGGTAADRHNAVRVLLPELHRKLREHLGVTFFAAMPTRDLLIAFSITDADVMARVRARIAEDFSRAQERGAGLSPKVFLVTPDGVAGDPHDAEDFDM